MKPFVFALAPFLASMLLIQFAPAGVVDPPEPPPPMLPGCGPFVRKNPQTQQTIHDDLGTCQTNGTYLPDFVYKRTVTEDIYTYGSKFFCSGWTIVPNGCGIGARPFPACPGNTCSNPG